MTLEAGPDLSAIVLCYRAEENALRVIQPLYEDLKAEGCSFELVLVANYWPDESDPTPDVVRDFAQDKPEARTLIRPKEGGMGWDMRSGFEAARGNYLIVIDGDEQNPVEDVLNMYRQMKRRGLDVMKGRRIARFDGYYRHLVSIAYNFLFVALFRTRGIWDINGKPKGLTRDAFERMELTSDDWFADAEIVLEAYRKNMRLDELPVIFHKQMDRASFVRSAAIREFLENMLRQRFARRR